MKATRTLSAAVTVAFCLLAPAALQAQLTGCDQRTIALSKTTLVAGTFGADYKDTVRASGGTGSYSWTVDVKSLPPGLNAGPDPVDRTGSILQIAGVPTRAGSYRINVRVNDSALIPLGGNCTSASLSIEIGCPAISVAPATIAAATAGSDYKVGFSATGGVSPHTYSISAVPPGMTFAGGALTGIPTTPGKFPFVVTATDANGCTGSTSYTLIVNCPVVTVGPASITNAVAGVSYKTAFGGSGGLAPYTYSISVIPAGMTFASGVLSGTPPAPGSFPFSISAIDANGCSGSKSYSLVVECPTINAGVASIPSAVVGFSYKTGFPGGGGLAPYSFSIDTVPPGMTFSAGVLSGTATAPGRFPFTVNVTDANGCRGSSSYTLIADCPAIAVGPASAAGGTVGSQYRASFSAANGVSPYTYSIDVAPAGLTFTSDGTLSGTPTTAGNFTFVVSASDANRCAGSMKYAITICPKITIDPSTAPRATVGVGYKAGFTAGGGLAPYSYSISGNVPPGLTFADGVLSGTPTTAGTYAFTITASDANRCSGSVSYGVIVDAPGCPTITVGPASVASVIVGTDYKAGFSASGGLAPYSYSIDVAPPGLTFSAGVLSGIPTTPGKYAFTVTANDGNRCVGSTGYTLVVQCPAITVGPGSVPDGVEGTGYKAGFSASGGTAPYSYSIDVLPPGLTFSDGVLTGTPARAGRYSFIVTASDANRCTGFTTYSLVVGSPGCPAVTVGPAAISNAVVGTPYRASFTATGGLAPHSYSVAGTLPPGLTFASSTLSGTPTTAGTFTFSVTATDANRCTGSTSYTLVVESPGCPAIAVGPAAISNPVIGTSYRTSFTATGGVPPHSYSAAGTLPPGMTFASATLSGTPTTAGTFTFSVTASDANRCSGSQSYTITVTDSTPVCTSITVLPLTLANGTVRTAYSTQLSTKGGAAPITYAVSAGGLPPGVQLSGDTISGTPTTAGSYRFTIGATDANKCTGSSSYEISIADVATCPSASASLSSPASGASFDGALPITFAWSAVTGAIGYDVMLSGDGGTTFTIAASTSGEQSTRASASLSSGSFIWLVRSRFGLVCKPTESASSRFTIVARTSCPTGVAQLQAPANGATGLSNLVTFSWSAVEKAVSYNLLLSVDGGGMRAVEKTTSTKIEFLVPSGVIDWTIEAVFENCPSTQPKGFRFTTKQNLVCATDAPVLLSPADGATSLTSPVPLQWRAVTGATSYRVHASIDGGAMLPIGTTTATQFAASLPQGRIVWQVEAVIDGCASTFSARLSFAVVAGASCSNNAAPVLSSPPNGASEVQSPVTFTWSVVPRAIGYKLFVSLDGSEFQLAGATKETSLVRIGVPGTVAWFVQAEFIGCEDTRSSTSRFTVAAAKSCPSGTINLLSPSAGASVPSPVSFAWSLVPEAVAYRVWVSTEGGAPSAVAKSESTTAVAGVASGTSEWYVEALFANCPSIFSPRSRFTALKANTCDANQPPTLVGPIGTATSGKVDFRWNAAAGAPKYRLWLSTGGRPFEDRTVTTDTHFETELLPGAYGWFVEALYDGCPAVASQRVVFAVPDTAPRCSADAPSLISPADGAANIASPVTLLWSSVPEAIAYRVFASKLGGDPELIGATTDTSITRPVPPGAFYWYVEAIFKGCPSTYSARFRFSVPSAASCPSDKPLLITPRDGADPVSSPVTFSWSPVSGGIRYVVVIKTANGSASPVGETTDTTMTRPIPPGTAEWWVVAFRSSCDPVESAHSTFTIPAPPACDARPPVLLSPIDGAPNVPGQVRFNWTASRGARGYNVWVAGSSGVKSLVATTTATEASVNLAPGPVKWFVEALFDGCAAIESAVNGFTVVPPAPVCRTPERPSINVVGQTVSGAKYVVRWTSVTGASSFELQESTSLDLSGAVTTVVNGTSATFTYTVTGAAQRRFYRVRGVSSCNESRGPYSDVVAIFIVPTNTLDTQTRGTAEIGVEASVVQTLFVPGTDPAVSFTARTDRPWLRVSPESGLLGSAGITFTLRADPTALFVGSNTGTIILTYGGAGAGKQIGHAAAPRTVPVSVSLVTPVSPAGKNSPPPDSLIIPAVAHAPGVNNSLFQSDVRIANTSAQTMKYQLNFTPSGTDGTISGSSTTIQIEPGATTALDDLLASFFGSGTTGSSSGTLEIRPLTSTSTSTALQSGPSLASPTIASSRTYNVTATGTLGQYIPAVPFSSFVGKSTETVSAILSLQQIAQSAAYRTNLGLVEASGEPAELMIRVYNASNELVAEIPESLRAAEHKQLNSILAQKNITLDDGRFEVEVTSATGKVTAYASRIDNVSGDPLLVSPILKSSARGTRYVLPGIAYTDGLARWRSDVRVFNSGGSATQATLTYFPQGNPSASMSKVVTVAAGQVLALDNILNTFFGITEANAGGSVLVSTSETSSLITSARTYAQTDAGTYGLSLDGIRPDQAVGLSERSLHLLQLEQSTEFRTNVGIVETSGKPVTVEVTLILPDSKVTPKVPITLAANGFTQFPLSAFNVGDAVYNARISIKVISGTGRISAYGSVVDNRTQDPTYVPAQ